MLAAKKTLKTCRKGHRFYKTSDCVTCPICQSIRKPSEGFFSTLSAPAIRALEQNGIKTLADLSNCSEREILSFHGMGKASLPILRKVLAAKGLSFRNQQLRGITFISSFID